MHTDLQIVTGKPNVLATYNLECVWLLTLRMVVPKIGYTVLKLHLLGTVVTSILIIGNLHY